MRVALIFLFICNFHSLLACSCGALVKIDKPAVAQAKTIFIGKISKIESTTPSSRRITFQVIESLKPDDFNMAIVYTGEGGADCGLDIKEGQEWYIFAYEKDGNSWVGLCGRSTLLSEHSILPNPYKRSYYKSAVRNYEKARRRARKEISFIKREM